MRDSAGCGADARRGRVALSTAWALQAKAWSWRLGRWAGWNGLPEGEVPGLGPALWPYFPCPDQMPGTRGWAAHTLHPSHPPPTHSHSVANLAAASGQCCVGLGPDPLVSEDTVCLNHCQLQRSSAAGRGLTWLLSRLSSPSRL